jgi:uncharacterized cupin superfamily protein
MSAEVLRVSHKLRIDPLALLVGNRHPQPCDAACRPRQRQHLGESAGLRQEGLPRAGDCAGFRASDARRHHLHNRSAAEARGPQIGTRSTPPGSDRLSCPDTDRQWVNGRFEHGNGDPCP